MAKRYAGETKIIPLQRSIPGMAKTIPREYAAKFTNDVLMETQKTLLAKRSVSYTIGDECHFESANFETKNMTSRTRYFVIYTDK